MTRAGRSWTAKRFYRNAAAAVSEDGYSVVLDGRPVKTPGGQPLVVSTEVLAEAMAAEWMAQAEVIRPDTMPLTQLSATVVDKVGPERRAIVDRLVSYATTDLLCYRAEHPADLAALQHASWQPLLDWVTETLGARLNVTAGVIPVDQPPHAIDALRSAVEELADVELTALASIVPASASLVVGLALVLGRIDDEAAFEISQVDESYQIDRWGDDIEAADRRRRLREEIRAAATFLALARDASRWTNP
jgi:chaperone required for assembly of F1-ATPase